MYGSVSIYGCASMYSSGSRYCCASIYSIDSRFCCANMISRGSMITCWVYTSPFREICALIRIRTLVSLLLDRSVPDARCRSCYGQQVWSRHDEFTPVARTTKKQVYGKAIVIIMIYLNAMYMF